MLNKLMKLKNKKGFTLVELIVVIAIIAILTAIIVPLVGRYSAQARYTTLNDAATTVSNSINNGLSDANQIGVIPSSVKSITGKKDATSGKFEVTVGAAIASSTNGTLTEAPNGSEAEKRAANRICAALAEALPNGATFFASIATSTVSGVIYSADSANAAPTAEPTAAYTTVAGFDNAYADSAGHAFGLSGKYIPATPSTPSSGT